VTGRGTGWEPAGIPTVELFTHPVCAGCREALMELSRLAEMQVIELVTWSLTTPAGKARSLETGVSTVPTALVGSSRRTLDSREALAALVGELCTERVAGGAS
jgi:hypothetical protein